MTATTTQPGFEEMLHQAGAKPPRYGRGKWTCPQCSKPTLSVDLNQELFNCFEAGCGFAGGIGRLRALLGLRRDWVSRSKFLAERRARRQAERAARYFLTTCRAVRLALCDLLNECERQAASSHETLLEHNEQEEVWSFLMFLYQNRRRMEATIILLGEGSVRTRREWLESEVSDRERMLDGILLTGGVFDDQGRFVEVAA